MRKDSECFCGGDGKYTDYNGAAYPAECPHCQGSGTKKCGCKDITLLCITFGRGREIAKSLLRDDDDPHWNFVD